MIDSKFLNRQALLNVLAASIGFALVSYLVSKFLILESSLRIGASGVTFLIAALFVFVASLIYLILAWLMFYRYREELSTQNTKLVRLLHYENIKLKIVFHKRNLWLTILL
jgi:formate hydrogenlyase subunit 3/multisubunit Na+/H+ antiporter MnhD subunit